MRVHLLVEVGEYFRHACLARKPRLQSVDDRQHAHDVWEKVAERKFAVLSDPGAKVIRKYGLLHEARHSGANIALRTTILIGPDGRERWRRVVTLAFCSRQGGEILPLQKSQGVPQNVPYASSRCPPTRAFRYFDKVLPCGLGCGRVLDFTWCSSLLNLLRCNNS